MTNGKDNAFKILQHMGGVYRRNADRLPEGEDCDYYRRKTVEWDTRVLDSEYQTALMAACLYAPDDSTYAETIRTMVGLIDNEVAVK